MDERSMRRVKEHLQQEDVQRRVLRYIEKGRAEATVTISRAAELFNLSENRLRDWEEYGLLRPLRPTGPKGRRLYTPQELDKLAIIRELIDAGYAPSDIPPDIDLIWRTFYVPDEQHRQNGQPISYGQEGGGFATLPINQRVDLSREDSFWRFFASHALRLSLLLLCEELPHTTACLVLPLNPQISLMNIQNVEDLEQVGEALVGWLNQNRSSQTLLVPTPTFEYASDFRLLPLAVMTEDSIEEEPRDRTYILLERRSRRLTLKAPIVETVRQLLRPLYENVELSRRCLGPGMRDVFDSSTDPDYMHHEQDAILHGLAETIIRLGGKGVDNHPRWLFSCILLPDYPLSMLSLQQRGLIVSAQSALSPHKVGSTAVVPQGASMDPCLRAFQSGHIVYHPVVSEEDILLANPNREYQIGSSIAVPVVGRDNVSVAVIYVTSPSRHAFSLADQRVLRMVGTMVGILLEIYQARMRPVGHLREMIAAPAIVDTQFAPFLTENEFIEHVETLLQHIYEGEEIREKDISFISLDIDNQSSLANKYGDRMARDISKAVGLRIQGQLRALKDDAVCEFYRISADRYYILLQGMPLEQARAKAELLLSVLSGSYQIDPQRIPPGQPTLPENMVTLTNITVRLGVSSYSYRKLKEILARYPGERAVVETRLLLTRFLDEVLDIGKRKGGNIVVSWDPDKRGYLHFPAGPDEVSR